MPDVTDLRPDDPEMIAGYRVVSRLGAGGQGVVYLATAPNGHRVAIKRLRLEDQRARQQFAKEVAAARRVAPFCTARVVDAQLEGPSPYVVSEFIDGLSLQQQVQRTGPLTGGNLQRMAIGTVTALAAIHQAGVVHRDFKPANVMMAADGPRVIDFGIARDLSTDTTVTSRVFGTPAYMAPEQIRGARVGPATDLFAWASVIAYAATGRAPFDAPHMVAVMHRISSGEPNLSGVPADLAPVLLRCLDKEPAMRPSAQQALAMLLGRPALDHDVADPTRVLAEATGIVHAASAARSPDAAAAATVVQSAARPAPTAAFRPVASPPAFGSPPAPGSSRGNSGSPPESGRTPPGPGWGQRTPTEPTFTKKNRDWLLAAVAVLVIGLGGWALTRTDLLGNHTSPSPTANPGARQPTKPPVTTPDAEITTDAPADNSGKGSNDDNSGPSNSGDSNDDSNDEGTIPDAFDGTWRGVAHQPNGFPSTWTVRIDLDEGETTGKVELEQLDCSGELSVTSASDEVLILDWVMDEDREEICADHGTLRLTVNPDDSDRLALFWQQIPNSDNQATGELRQD